MGEWDEMLRVAAEHVPGKLLRAAAEALRAQPQPAWGAIASTVEHLAARLEADAEGAKP